MKSIITTTLTCFLTLTGCHSNDDPMMMNTTSDQSNPGSSDMASSSMPDLSDPNAPGMVRYSYICDDKPEKTVELPHVRFGADYHCIFQNSFFSINVTDGRVPVDFRLAVPGYHGPGTYSIIADVFSGTGFSECVWPSIQIQDKNCRAMWGQMSSCCTSKEAQARALTCTVTVQQHSLTRVTGSYECLIQADSNGPNSPFACPYLGKAQVQGSFDFGPQDCM